eukprot:1530804-Prymnesium_polylepis.1
MPRRARNCTPRCRSRRVSPLRRGRLSPTHATRTGHWWDPLRNDTSPMPDPARRGLVYAYPGSLRPPDTYREAALRFANNLSYEVTAKPVSEKLSVLELQS